MKSFALALALFITTSGSSFAVLPPLWQNVAELKAILNDEQLGKNLESGDVIESIEKSDKGWLIVTNHKEVEVEVTYKEATRPGPAQFDLKFVKSAAD